MNPFLIAPSFPNAPKNSELEYFAAVGTDGMNPCVWGIGTSYDAALADAYENLEVDGVVDEPDDLHVREITKTEFEDITENGGGMVNSTWLRDFPSVGSDPYAKSLKKAR